jgi:hypothetical protein
MTVIIKRCCNEKISEKSLCCIEIFKFLTGIGLLIVFIIDSLVLYDIYQFIAKKFIIMCASVAILYVIKPLYVEYILKITNSAVYEESFTDNITASNYSRINDLRVVVNDRYFYDKRTNYD